MAQELSNRQDQKETDLSKEKDNIPFLQVDRHTDPFSNFISNFKRKFKRPREWSLWKLFAGKPKKIEKPSTKPSDIIGTAKTVFRTGMAAQKKAVRYGKAKNRRKKWQIQMD